MKQKLLHLLNIRPDEAWVVSNLFWLQFFQGMGVAIFNVSAFTLFLEHFEVVSLSKVYIFSGFLLFITGYIYTKFEHSLHIKKLVFGVILFIGFWTSNQVRSIQRGSVFNVIVVLCYLSIGQLGVLGCCRINV